MDELIWHDLESGGYAADLDFWASLGPARMLELGAGAGRVSLMLAVCGSRVSAVDLDGELLDALGHRAGELGAEVETITADARTLDLGTRFEHVIAPAAFVQLLTRPEDRVAMMERAGRHLEPGGILWLAVHPDLDQALFDPALPPGPTWVGPYESRIEDARREGDLLILRFRRRDRLAERTTTAEVIYADAGDLEAEALEAGLRLRERVVLPEDDRYSESVILGLAR
ncbi:MAG: class I SAM-dependent methyltransferase [Solirubrobacterales bacterium]|nr:class I SAM-dependent methyltransferase [Solirubrobacterales bacterium]MCB8971193.1 class I SAM-dependent methyltransferase [Thermoleophilales bacterium]